MKSAALLIAASEGDSNMFYATRFFVPDPFIFFQIDGKKTIVMSDLELDRARSQAKVDEVLSLSKLSRELKRQGISSPRSVDLIDHLFRRRGVKEIQVPENFPIHYADLLRKKRYRIRVKEDPFFESRLLKTAEEITHITKTLRATEAAFECAVQHLRKSKIRGRLLFYRGRPLASEDLKRIIHVKLIEAGCVASHTIVACGEHGVDPHHEGTGPLLAHTPLIFDIFPKSASTGYYADFSRTVVRGRASPRLKKMYRAVQAGQEIAFRMIRNGADGERIHRKIVRYFESLGFKTGERNGRMQGFFHGTGHGLGLDIHEPPRISPRQDILRAGEVVTVEPGLYYSGVGGVRLEDLVVVTQEGNVNLTQYPKFLEI